MTRFRYPLVGSLLLGFGCNETGLAPPPPSGPPPPPGVTQATVSLSTPNDDDGALVVSVKGADLSSFEPASPSYSFYSRVIGGQEAKLIVIGDVTDGPLFTIQLSAAHELSSLTVSVEQVAARTDTLRADLREYRLNLAGSTQP